MGIPFDQLVIQTINGLVSGMILALVASGLTLIFGIMDVVNFAHGELFMLGAYVGVITLAATGSFWVALIVAAVVLRRLTGGRGSLERTLDVLALVACAVVAAVVSAAFGPTSLRLGDVISADELGRVFRTWALSDATGVLVCLVQLGGIALLAEFADLLDQFRHIRDRTPSR